MAEDSTDGGREAGTKAKISLKIRRLREAWVKAVNDAKGENLRVGAEKKAKLADITAKAARSGYPKRAWAKLMAIWDYDDLKRVLIEDTLRAEDDALVDGFARAVVDSVDALPLFHAADLAELRARVKNAESRQDETERAARARAADEDEPPDNVTQMKVPA
jgi:hypothetical protein